MPLRVTYGDRNGATLPNAIQRCQEQRDGTFWCTARVLLRARTRFLPKPLRQRPADGLHACRGRAPDTASLCRGENVVERYGIYEVQRSFDPGDEISLIGFVVVKATDDRVWETLRSEAMDCSPDSDGFASGDVAMVADFSVEPTEGPKMGDESIWLTTSSSITSSVTDSSSSESPALLVRSGDFVMWLSGFDGMPQGDLEEYARAALD